MELFNYLIILLYYIVKLFSYGKKSDLSYSAHDYFT